LTNPVPYCTAPWNGIAVRENGDVRTCCSGDVILGNLNQDSISNILCNDQTLTIQKKMLGGEPDVKNCKACLKQEANTGLSSLRQHYLKYYPTVIPNQIVFNSLDIRWNNTCNLSCLYCSAICSSTWADKLNIANPSPVKSYQDDLLNFILDRSSSVKEIMLVGGEPMLMKQNYQLFKKLPDSTRISILTNLSYDLEKLPCVADLLSRPKENLLWNISVENTNQQFEYVRNGGNWDQMEKNINFLMQQWGNTVTVNMVYSMFSAFDLPATIEKFHSLGIKKFNLQTYFGDPHMDVFRMPKAIQQLALKSLQQAESIHCKNLHTEDQPLFIIQNIDFLKTTLNHGHKVSNLSKEGFLNQIDWYDQWCVYKFHDLWPHVIDLIHKHLD
jgi:MoaA/NifB/PqqE/SkfB family radical SAM enzyme